MPLQNEFEALDAEEETYSDGEGPECPRCHAVWTADDKEYFDEANGMKMKCSCGAELFVQPETRTTWTTTVVSSPNNVIRPNPNP